jgi:ankyrin repeat protein
MHRPMYEAIAANNVSAVRALIAQGFDTRQIVDDRGNQAIDIAIEMGAPDVCALLLESVGDTELERKWLARMLYPAIENGSTATVRLLLAAGADPSASPYATPVLSLAVRKGDAELVGVLIAAGAPVDVTDSAGDTPLYSAVVACKVATCRLLLANGADVNRMDRAGRSPLHSAVERGNLPMCQFLIRNGADAYHPDMTHETNTVLAQARRLGPHEVIKSAAAGYLTRFQHAVRRGDVAYVTQVLGADPDVDVMMTTMAGKSLFDLAGVFEEMHEVLRSCVTSREVELGVAPSTLGVLIDATPRREPRSLSPL